MSRRLYLGRLPPDAQQADVQKLFDGYGRIVDCRVMTGFGFVEFENSKDAEEIVQNFNGKPFLGQSIIVEFARENRRRDFDGGRPAPPSRDSRRDAPPPRARRPPGFRISVSGISRDTSWQDLKDFGREAGNVSFADVDRDFPGSGVLEYLTQDDADDAVKRLDGKELRGTAVRVEHADPDANKDGGRDRYRSPPRRSRSPPRRRDEYRRRSRSPRAPPPRREDDRREDHRRDDSRRDEYRRDDRDRGHRDVYDRRGDDREGGSSARY